MSLLHKVAAVNKQVKPNKIDRASEYISSIIDNEQQPEVDSLRFWLGERPKDIKSQQYLEAVAAQAMQKLGELGIRDWFPDLEASRVASQVPNTYGYGNESVKIWSKDHHWLVFQHAVELAEVVPIRPSQPQIVEADRLIA
jgi:hypothetical protein